MLCNRELTLEQKILSNYYSTEPTLNRSIHNEGEKVNRKVTFGGDSGISSIK